MHILHFSFYELNNWDLYNSLIAQGHTVHMEMFLPDQTTSAAATDRLNALYMENPFDMVISFNFFERASDFAQQHSIPYISWLYDCPMYQLYSGSVHNSCNYIFSFDYIQYLALKERKVSNAYHLPLAVNTKRLNKQLGTTPWLYDSSFCISFIGNFSLYTDTTWKLGRGLSSYYNGYLEGLMASQSQVYGYNLIYELLSDEFVEATKSTITFIDNGMGQADPKTIYADFVNKELSGRERIKYLNSLANQFDVTLFTGEDTSIVPNATPGGSVNFYDEMPYVFCTSKINLNISSRSITSGIPLRCLDVMGTGGFLLSNYQPELAQYFVDGSELILFSSEEELLDKTAYYLKHETERIQIARRGFEKIQSEFSYEVQLKRIFEKVLS